ncbi:transcriptional regulator ClgR [Lachnospiraceae bacterium]|jgi:transcriptional regulator with XRE-family HTH domain|nr:transcriptional regulator ClgR [Lachnospiraceae bacterium]
MYKESFDVSKRITYLRTQKNYSVNKLANAAGISQSFLRDVELGNKNITVEYLSYICEALDISLADFFSDSFSERMSNDFVTSKIYRLTEKQRAALLAFLDAMAE